jgi:hypothetical protein
VILVTAIVGMSLLQSQGAGMGLLNAPVAGAASDPTVPTIVAGTFVGGITNQAPTPPTHQAGDALLLCVEATAVIAAPSGWSEIADSPSVRTETRLHVFRRDAVDGATPTPTVAIASSNHLWCGILRIRGADLAALFDDTAQTQSGGVGVTSIAWGAVTTAGKNRLIVGIATWPLDDAGPIGDTYTNANLTAIAEVCDGGTTFGNGGGILAFSGTMANAGDTGASSCLVNQATLYTTLTLAVKPA